MGKEEKKKMIEMLRANEVEQFEDSKELVTQTKIEKIDEKNPLVQIDSYKLSSSDGLITVSDFIKRKNIVKV